MNRIRSWSPLSRRLLAMALLALALLGLWDYVVAPVAGSFSTQSESIETLEGQYIRFAEAANRAEAHDARRAALKADESWKTLLVNAPSNRDATSAYHGKVRGLVDGSALFLKSFQPLPDRVENGFTILSVRLEFDASQEAFAAFLESTMRHRPMLQLDALTIRQQPRVTRRDGGFDANGVNVRVDVRGFWRAPGEAS